ncbi:MAG: putative 4-aminobutyrate aminotransferase [Olpidium bornovanus]|uniref:4-aminobutyrate aminotransferase n=1 Tax=Olpidium bornovanus TaxID=278681 RepID=A0A8H8A1T6_9FUNG|nr:MAG: putative 4-aminobutyrate aminotransferase [Olpidium bornovanus]
MAPAFAAPAARPALCGLPRRAPPTRRFSSRPAAAEFDPVTAHYFPLQPVKPIMQTSVPGPATAKYKARLEGVADARAVFFVTDMSKSMGNYIADTISALVNRPALGVVPTGHWIDLVENSLMKIAPKGLNNIKAAFMFHQHRKRVSSTPGKQFVDMSEFTAEEIESCMQNAPPGSPHLGVLSFERGFHGRTLKYPLEQHTAENAEEEDRREKPEIAAVIVEPIQGEGGDRWASPAFFRSLRKLCRDRGIVFIVDEVQTGVGATGKFWAHEYWDEEGEEDSGPAADIVTFSKKMQLGGFFYRREYRPSQAWRNFNTWLGDPARLIQATTTVNEIRSQKLLDRVSSVGNYVKGHLADIAASRKATGRNFALSNVRGLGTFLAFDLPTPALRDAFVTAMRNRGVHLAGCGERSVRLRPMLVFGKNEADVFLGVLSKVA